MSVDQWCIREPMGRGIWDMRSVGSAYREHLPCELFCILQVFRAGPVPVKEQEFTRAMIPSKDRRPRPDVSLGKA
jgi:hypothetical protein